MSQIRIEFVWKTASPLAIRSGHASGALDAAVRSRDGKPEIPGEAVKGAIREAAERLLRWQSKLTVTEDDGSPWFPPTERLRRIFACGSPGRRNEPHAFYKFNTTVGSKALRLRLSSTAIHTETGTAKDETLRTLEYWAKDIVFNVRIDGRNGQWRKGGKDYEDLQLLLAAILSTTAVGGDQGSGSGWVDVQNLTIEVDGKPQDVLPEFLEGWTPEAE